MSVRDVDVVVLGAGTAGLNAYRQAVANGASALLVDPGPLGTTCARVGCMPSKLLIAAADVAHTARTAERFGVQVADVRADPVAVMERVRRMRDMFVTKTINGSIAKLRDAGKLVQAEGRITGPHEVVAGDAKIRAKTMVIATGSVPSLPGPWRPLREHVLTSDEIFELERLPADMLVVGAGAMGLELGQALSRLGVDITVLDVEGRIAGLSDPEVAEAARELIGAELELHLRHELLEAEPVDGGVRVRFVGDDGAVRERVWSHVLVATGRRPKLEGLGLRAAGIDPTLPIDPHSGRLGDSWVYVAGDAAGGRMLQHEAAHEGRVAGAAAALHPEGASVERKAALAIAFTHPQVASVGLSWPELDPAKHVVGAFDMVAQGRAKVVDEAHGRIRVYAERDTGRLVGASLLVKDAEHLGHLLAWAVQGGSTVHDVLDLPFYHPVLEEGLESALKSAAQQLARDAA